MEDKYKEFDPEELESFVSKYKSEIKTFGVDEIKNCSCEKKLSEHYEKYSDLLTNVSTLSIKYFNDDGNNEAKKFFDMANRYIVIIQNRYLNPINYKLNQLNNKKSLNFAWIVAIVSFMFAIGSIALTYYYGENPNLCSCCSIETEQTQVISEKEKSKIDNKTLPLVNDTINKSE
ncbi:hypothetical protein FACS1894155_05040 [Bacteroidia bacterium]|nr:hypothetical protein FACS1894155_05040 [Bacteroidia bacterium]